MRRSTLLALAACIAYTFLTREALAAPWIVVDPENVLNSEPVLVGEYWTTHVTVTNLGDETLIVDDIGTLEIQCGPFGWLSASGWPLEILPGEVNAQQFDVTINLAEYDVPAVFWGQVFLKSNAFNIDSLTVWVVVTVSDPNQVVFWDTVQTDEELYEFYGNPVGEPVGLAVSDHGAYGLPGWRAAHMDFEASGTECGSRLDDQVYLRSGSPFVLVDNGAEVSLTTSSYQSGSLRAYDWRQAPDSPGLSGGGDGFVDSVYTGKLISSDDKIGLERIYYGEQECIYCKSTIIVLTKVYAADGQTHSGVTIGSVTDWSVPSDEIGANSSGCGQVPYGCSSFIYVQGTDTLGGSSCQSHSSRYAAEVFIGWRSSQEYLCTERKDFWGVFAANQELLLETDLSRDGLPINPPQPDAQAWRDDIQDNPGCNSLTGSRDQAVWLTYVHNYELVPDDTLFFWTALLSVRNGSLEDLVWKARVAHMMSHMISGCEGSCCSERVGNANGTSGPDRDEPTIGDVSVMIDAKFIAGTCVGILECLNEADINQSGGIRPTCDDITIGDISTLIDYLFITGSTLGLPHCDEW